METFKESADETSALAKLEVERKSGCEKFKSGTRSFDFDLLSFWQWSASDLVSNAMRGILAEYLVARALGLARGEVRDEWKAFDLQTDKGLKIEVKSAAYVQRWFQKRYSAITFSTRPTLEWNEDSNLQSKERRRQADVYVFALLMHKDKPSINPMDVNQWEFYVVPTKKLDGYKRSQHSITLKSLREKLGIKAVRYEDLKTVIEKPGAQLD